jgi:hypothetical protein
MISVWASVTRPMLPKERRPPTLTKSDHNFTEHTLWFEWPLQTQGARPFFFVMVLGFESRTSQLLGRHATT